MKVGIIGLGLMGGSLALNLKNMDFVQSVHGYDHNVEHQKMAKILNIVDDIVSFEDILKMDVIILAIPVIAIQKILKDFIGVPEDTLIMDLGSTKAKIISNIPAEIRKNFIAAHPMTGTEHSGPTAAIENLYTDKVVVLCDLDNSGKLQQDLANKIFKNLNMNIKYMNATDHDRHAAFISHMPHIISYSLASTVLKQEKKKNILSLAAGGFKSMSRLAKSNPYMWEDIFRQNPDNLLEAIELFQDELENMKQDIKSKNWEDLREKMLFSNNLQKIFK
jgi:prephenate dehydrogenase